MRHCPPLKTYAETSFVCRFVDDDAFTGPSTTPTCQRYQRWLADICGNCVRHQGNPRAHAGANTYVRWTVRSSSDCNKAQRSVLTTCFFWSRTGSSQRCNIDRRTNLTVEEFVSCNFCHTRIWFVSVLRLFAVPLCNPLLIATQEAQYVTKNRPVIISDALEGYPYCAAVLFVLIEVHCGQSCVLFLLSQSTSSDKMRATVSYSCG